MFLVQNFFTSVSSFARIDEVPHYSNSNSSNCKSGVCNVKKLPTVEFLTVLLVI
jgi:hypothetical protein